MVWIWLVACTSSNSLDRLDGEPLGPEFRGAVALPSCSGSVVHLEETPSSGPAHVLTNGHCLDELSGGGPEDVLVDYARALPIYRSFRALPVAGVTTVVYATMHETDIALLELDVTYDELSEQGIPSSPLATQPPAQGDSVDVASAFTRGLYSCSVEAVVDIVEEDIWTWTESLRLSEGCNLVPGTSGSALWSDDGDVVGVANTGYRGGEACTLNNPCEIEGDGTVATVRRSYAQQVYGLTTCLTDDFQIDLDAPGCELPSGPSM